MRDDGIALADFKRAQERRQREAGGNSFEAIAREWLDKTAGVRAQSTTDDIRDHLERNLFPWIGRRAIAEIEAGDLLDTLRRVEARNAPTLAHRLRGHAGAIWRYAIASGRARHDVASCLHELGPRTT